MAPDGGGSGNDQLQLENQAVGIASAGRLRQLGEELAGRPGLRGQALSPRESVERIRSLAAKLTPEK